MNLFKFLGLMGLLLFVFTACHQFEEQQPLPFSATVDVDTQTQLIGESFASLLAESSTRAWLKTSFEEADGLTGYSEILFRSILTDEILPGLTFGQALFQSYAAKTGMSVEESEVVIHEFLRQTPNLHLNLPFQFLEWNPNDKIPHVAIEHFSKEYPDNKMTAYTHLGEDIKISSLQEPETVTIVVGFHELTDKKGQLIPVNTFIPNPEVDLPDPATLRGTGEEFRPRIVFSDETWQALDENGWFNNKAEIKFIIAAPKYSTSPIGSFYCVIPKKTIKDKEWWCATGIGSPFLWYASTYGDAITLKVIEYDGNGSETTSTVGYKDPNTNINYSTSIKTKTGDEDLGYLTVHKNDPQWQMYGNGQVRLYLVGTHAGGTTCN
ncbi:MAG: hypothetical protein AAF587_18540 [Bacteroidota bacterium]